MNGDEDEEFNGFLALHVASLQASRVPAIYWKSLYYKIVNEVCLSG